MRDYPLCVEALYDDGSICAFYTKGHHSTEDFVCAVKDGWGDEIDPKMVRQDWCRWEICQVDYGPDGWQRCLNPAPQGKRGVFPVTEYYR